MKRKQPKTLPPPEPHPPAPPAEVTVFVISCGKNPNLPGCLAALKDQQPPVTVERIHNVAPMSAAFQQMLDRCKTPFFVQVDEDMILWPNAVATMLATIKQQPPDVGFCVFLLRDAHLDMLIQGVKIYRHEVMREFPYNLSVISCEKNQMQRMQAAGYRTAEFQAVLGEHSPKWTPELVFERYRDLMEKWKRYGYEWLEPLPRRLHEKYQKRPDTTNLYAYLGAAASIAQPGLLRDQEKDFRVRTPEYIRARSWHSQPTGATIFMSSRCNLRCQWCMRQSTGARPPAVCDADEALVDELLRRFPTITGVCLCGFGEPMLNTQWFRIIERLRRYSVFVNLITNGTMLESSLALLLAYPPDALSVSLNAATAAEHAATTGCPGLWDHILYGIHLVCASAQIPVFLSRVCTVKNLHTVPDFLDLAADLGVAGVDLHNLLPHDVGTPDKLDAFLQSVLTVKHESAIEALKSHPAACLVRSWPVPIDPDCPQRRCEMCFDTIAVDGARNVSICNSIWPPMAGNGSLRDPKVWHSDYCERFRQRFAGDELEPECKYCFRNYA